MTRDEVDVLIAIGTGRRSLAVLEDRIGDLAHSLPRLVNNLVSSGMVRVIPADPGGVIHFKLTPKGAWFRNKNDPARKKP